MRIIIYSEDPKFEPIELEVNEYRAYFCWRNYFKMMPKFINISDSENFRRLHVIINEHFAPYSWNNLSYEQEQNLLKIFGVDI